MYVSIVRLHMLHTQLANALKLRSTFIYEGQLVNLMQNKQVFYVSKSAEKRFDKKYF